MKRKRKNIHKELKIGHDQALNEEGISSEELKLKLKEFEYVIGTFPIDPNKDTNPYYPYKDKHDLWNNRKSSVFKEKDLEYIMLCDYDLTNQDRIIRGRFPGLEIVAENFIMELKDLLNIKEALLVSADLLKFGEFVNSLRIPTYIKTTYLHNGLFSFIADPSSLHAINQSNCGVENIDEKIYNLSKLDIEVFNDISKTMTDLYLNEFNKYTKEELVEIKQDVKTNPQFWGIIPPSDIIASITFELKINESFFPFQLALPYEAFLESYKKRLSALYKNKHSGKKIQLPKSLKIDISYQQEINITIEKLEKLKKGDIIDIDDLILRRKQL
jgi:flagellar motor switch protein FliM